MPGGIGLIKRKDTFYNGRKFCIPKSCFILFALPTHEWKKLDDWVRNGQRPQIALASNGEVFLINDQKLAKYTTKKVQKIERESSCLP